MPRTFKIGDRLWMRSTDWPGATYSEYQICDQTPRSWVVLRVYAAEGWMGQQAKKYGKKIPKTFRGFQIGTEAEARLHTWALNHRSDIVRQVSYGYFEAKDILTIARLIGYKDLPEGIDEIKTSDIAGDESPDASASAGK